MTQAREQQISQNLKRTSIYLTVSAALGSVGGHATILLKGAVTGTTKVAGTAIKLTGATERVAAGAIGASEAAAVGAAQAGRKGGDMLQGGAVQIANGVTSPVPSGTIVSKGAEFIESAMGDNNSGESTPFKKDIHIFDKTWVIRYLL